MAFARFLKPHLTKSKTVASISIVKGDKEGYDFDDLEVILSSGKVIETKIKDFNLEEFKK